MINHYKKYLPDITYIKVKSRWLYLSVMIDLYNREIISSIYSHCIDSKLALDTVKKLKQTHHITEKCILHSDHVSYIH